MININEVANQCKDFNIVLEGLPKEKFEEIIKLLGKDVAYTNIEVRFLEDRQEGELEVVGIYIKELKDILHTNDIKK